MAASHRRIHSSRPHAPRLLGLLALLLVLPASAWAFDLGVRVDLPTGDTPYALAIADLNDDGLPDLVVVNQGSSTVSVLRGTDGGGFADRTDYAVNADPRSVAIGDVNGDARRDLVVACAGANTVSVLLNNGLGGFAAATNIPTGEFPLAVAIGDLNRDGWADLITTNAVQTVSVLLATGPGTFAVHAESAAPGFDCWSVSIGDLNDDGSLDLAVGSDGLVDSMMVLTGNGAGGFGTSRRYATGLGPRAMIGDVNGDGRADLIAANFNSNSVSVLLANGSGGFGPKHDYATGGSPRSVAIGDVSGDGVADLVTANEAQNTVSVLAGDGAGGFMAKVDFPAGTFPSAVAVADLNGDGPDVVVLNGSANTASLLFARGAGGFRAPTSMYMGIFYPPTSAAIIDLNSDGLPDLATTIYQGSAVPVGNGDGLGHFDIETLYNIGSSPSSSVVGDLNGDHLPDLVVANASASVTVLLNELGTATDLPTGGGANTGVAIADVNVDGRADLVVANDSARVAVFLGDGAGGFGAPLVYPATARGSIAIGQFNADAFPDLVMSNPFGHSIAVMLGNGGGGFSPETRYTTVDDPQNVAVGDLNGDGKDDLAVSNLTTNSVALRFGNGTGGFSAPTYIPLGAGVRWVALQDMSGDGRLDLVATTTAGNIAVMLGNGAGGFGSRIDYPTGTDPRSLTIADVNLDGSPDVLSPALVGTRIVIMLGLTRTHTTVLVDPYPVALGASFVVSATVTTSGPESPTGSVRFFDGSTLLGTAPVVAGGAQLTVTAAHLGDHAITAVYVGDDKSLASVSPAKTMHVGFGPVNCRFASSVVAVSSQLGAPGYAAIQALGPPNVYPAYGDNAAAWSSSTADGSVEFLQLAFTNPAPINFVNVYETLAPGAISSISVKDPATGVFQVVWSGTATAAPAVSRLFTATFAETPFAVSEVRLNLNSPAVPGRNEIDAVGIGKIDYLASSQWASGLTGFSSQWTLDGPSNWYASQALGPPDVYPNYADSPLAWATLNPDDPAEYLQLSYATPSPISFVNVVETWLPSTLTRVSVKNPNTGLFEQVWSGTPGPAPEVARLHTVSFPETRFLVREVKLEFDMSSVQLWNEIDAVGIGRCACAASPVDVPAAAEARPLSTIEWARPNPFTTSTGVTFSLARAGNVKVEVFDVTGQRVAQVMNRMLPAGHHDARWDGRGASGRAVASGIYYLRVESADLNGTRKIVKIE